MRRLREQAAAPALAGVFICAALLSGGCASPQVALLRQARPADVPVQAKVVDIPFFAQADYECGPAALAMVMTAAGVSTTPDALVPLVYLPARKATLQVEIPVAARRAGLVAFELAPSLDAVLREVAAGHPVIVFQNLSLPWYPVWHYAVVIGYDLESETLLMHSGTTRAMPLSLSAFERTWARGTYWAMVALPPDRLPATADAGTMASALVALERVNPAAALQAYGSALQRWPSERTLLLGRGNAAYALGNLSEAQRAYMAATVVVPEFADAWNNLAQVLLEQQQLAAAEVAIERAVALGGARLGAYEELKGAIAAARKK